MHFLDLFSNSLINGTFDRLFNFMFFFGTSKDLSKVLPFISNSFNIKNYLRRSNCPKSFLTSCIPYLQLYPFTINIHSSNFEINSYGSNIIASKCIISKS